MTLRTVGTILIAGALAAGPRAQTTSPQAEISNKEIKATLHLPDVKTGYYRATRFDWSGSVASLTWNGHSYFGQWFTRYDPLGNDSITGPVEEFDSVGYDEAKVGERFVRIGVGAIEKPVEPRYRQFSTYPIADNGTWTIKKGSDRVEFIHELKDTNGYAYAYSKIVRLDGNKLILDHRLKNTGRKPIVTQVYNHDFFMLDNQPTGPDFVVTFPFTPKNVTPMNGLVELRGNTWTYPKELQPRQSFQSELTGFGPSPKDYDFRVENSKTGAGVRQTGDRPIAKINVWSPRSTVCPEAFIDVKAQPGKDFTWRISYEFYQVPGVTSPAR